MRLRQIQPPEIKLLAEWIPIWEILTGQAFINHDQPRFAQNIVCAKSSSPQYRDSHGSKIIWRNAVHFCGRFLAGARLRLTGDGKITLTTNSAERDIAVDRSGLHFR